VHVAFPNGGETLNGTRIITWTSGDFDSDILIYDIFFSANNGTDWTALAAGFLVTEYSWNTTEQADGDSYMIRIIASDGEDTGHDESDDAFSLDNSEEGVGGLDTLILIAIGATVAVVVVVILIVMKRQGRI
jgi:hypothetical protein